VSATALGRAARRAGIIAIALGVCVCLVIGDIRPVASASQLGRMPLQPVPGSDAWRAPASLEVRSGPIRRIIAPGQVATLPLGTGRIDGQLNGVVPIDATAVTIALAAAGDRPEEVAAWRVERPEFPADSALVFRLLGERPADLTLTITLPEAGALQFSLRITELPIIGPADAGRTIELNIGDRFRVEHGDRFVWQVNIADEHIIAPVPGPSGPEEGAPLYEARQPGVTILRIMGTPTCPDIGRPCVALASVEFDVTIRVR
jgi:hypothetical protein